MQEIEFSVHSSSMVVKLVSVEISADSMATGSSLHHLEIGRLVVQPKSEVLTIMA
ncbi:Protein kinase domain-containing protein [Psidium guajava]|nr:Protein kinase domain-containing protein [Psidium guajava]